MIDLIVPTIEGREDSLARCLESFPDLNHIVIKDKPSCGEAWIEGIEQSTAEYLLLCADDIEAHPELDLDVCVEVVDRGHLPAPIVYRPNGSIESAGGDMGAPGCLLTDVRDDWSPVDFTPMPFMGRWQVERVGMIPAHYFTDVWASHRGRQLGYNTALRHGYKLIHHHEMLGRRSDTTGDKQIYDEAMRAND